MFGDSLSGETVAHNLCAPPAERRGEGGNGPRGLRTRPVSQGVLIARGPSSRAALCPSKRKMVRAPLVMRWRVNLTRGRWCGGRSRSFCKRPLLAATTPNR